MFNSKDNFYSLLEDHYNKQPNKKPYTKKKQEMVIKEIQHAKMIRGRKTRREYYLLKTYDILTAVEDHQHYLIKKVEAQQVDSSHKIKYVVAYEDLFDRLQECHIRTGHGGSGKMRKDLTDKYCIPRPAVVAYLKICQLCNEKKCTSRKIAIRPTTSKAFNGRARVDLIDYQSTPDGPYKWILNYQDHSTKFLCLRPLQSERAIEIAHELLEIFLTFGAPRILQSNNGRKFINDIIRELKEIWSDCLIVNGRSRHPESQGSIECSNQDIENMLQVWMSDNKSTNWSVGLYFVQWQKNNSFNRTIGRSPYKALFGDNPRMGPSSTNLSKSLIVIKENMKALQNIPEQHKDDTPQLKVEIDSPTESLFEPDNIQNVQIKHELMVTEQNTVENLSETEINIQLQKTTTNQEKTAQKVLAVSRAKRAYFQVNDCVLLSISKADQGPADVPNIICVIISTENNVFQLGTKHGLIKGWFGGDVLEKATCSSLNVGEVNLTKFLSLRKTVDLISNEQGMKKCTCKPSQTQCKFSKCPCFKAKMLCTSRCHASLSCVNK